MTAARASAIKSHAAGPDGLPEQPSSLASVLLLPGSMVLGGETMTATKATAKAIAEGEVEQGELLLLLVVAVSLRLLLLLLALLL